MVDKPLTGVGGHTVSNTADPEDYVYVAKTNADAESNAGDGRAQQVGRLMMALAAATLTALADAPTQAGGTRYLSQPGREGMFVWSASDQSANVAGDPEQGVYVAPSSDPDGSSGAWVRIPGISLALNGGIQRGFRGCRCA
jgi:hypothetical protein